MPNTHRVRKDLAYLDLRNKDGDVVAVAKVDRSLLPQLKERTWVFNPETGYVYANGRGGKPRVYLHRLVAGTHQTKMWTDHKNGDKLDNRRYNLRAVNASQSQMNKRTKRGSLRQIHPTGNGRWQAIVSKSFATVEEAQVWRDAVQAHVHGIDFMVECGLWGIEK